MTRIPNNWDGKARGKSAQTPVERAVAIEFNNLFVIARAAQLEAVREGTPTAGANVFRHRVAMFYKDDV